MKKILMVCAALALFATSAFAFGVDLSVGVCPGVLGSSLDAGTQDCSSAGPGVLVLNMGFQPFEASSDLTAIDVVIDLNFQGDLNSSSAFWDFETTNPAALGVTHARPATGCTTYAATWSPVGSGEGAAPTKTSPTIERIRALCFRPTPLSVVANQKLFGMQITVDLTTSAEFDPTNAANASHLGCGTIPTVVLVNDVFPRRVDGSPTVDLSGTAGFGNCNLINGGTGAMCAAVPAKKHTWGQLKSLYR